jgi:Uma2 family endonuclease
MQHSYEDYLRALDDSSIKLEFSAGIIYAMAGGTLAHADLSVAVSSALRQQLPPTCRVLSSDAKVRVEASDLAAFPDVSVVCGEPVTSRIDAHALTNPVLLVEVTSRSTEDYDRGEKLGHYQSLASLRAVIFVSHRERRLTLVSRSPSGWTTHDFVSGQRVVLTEPAVSLAVDEVYAGIALDPA